MIIEMKVKSNRRGFIVTFLSRSMLCVLMLMISSFTWGCPITADDHTAGGRCVNAGGYQMYMRVYGKPKPVVIFDAGSGDDSTTWNSVAPKVAKFARVVVYDRAGLGKSQIKPGNKPLSSRDAVNALKILLKNENIQPPYILVGHSIGGLNMQLFAEMYPRDIAGVVLIDSVSRNQNSHDPFPPKTANYYLEAITFDQSRTEVKNAGSFPAVPLIVLTATSHGSESAQREAMWQKWQKEISKLSPKGKQIIARGSGHYIQKQQPRLVIDAIATVIKESSFSNNSDTNFQNNIIKKING